MKINAILDDYRKGEFDTRLSLFLNFRDLRSEFMAIDEAEFNRQQADALEKKSLLQNDFSFSDTIFSFFGNLCRKVTTALKAI